MMWRLENAELGAYDTVGHPVRFSQTPARPGRGAPTLGQDSKSVRLDFGWSAEEIGRLKQEAVVK
jgi:crotonobetainyl-CoA:carnitine CoA-transferase CaiB-like acyl-CoA transferase